MIKSFHFKSLTSCLLGMYKFNYIVTYANTLPPLKMFTILCVNFDVAPTRLRICNSYSVTLQQKHVTMKRTITCQRWATREKYIEINCNL